MQGYVKRQNTRQKTLCSVVTHHITAVPVSTHHQIIQGVRKLSMDFLTACSATKK